MRSVSTLYLGGVAALAVLLYGAYIEVHVVRGLGGNDRSDVSGAAFNAGVTYDSYLLKGGELYDVRSLQPETARVKDCKT